MAVHQVLIINVLGLWRNIVVDYHSGRFRRPVDLRIHPELFAALLVDVVYTYRPSR